MSLQPSRAPSWSEAPASLSAPAKVFLLGEYAVLGGAPALVAALGPRFELCVRRAESQASAPAPFHPESPAGRLFSKYASRLDPALHLEFLDPFAGAGGFGASTAQFALLAFLLHRLMGFFAVGSMGDEEIWEIWRTYRELSSGASRAPLPSGADLIAQCRGGLTLVDIEARTARSLSIEFAGSGLLVFSAAHQAGRKVATHEHLARLRERGFPERDSGLISELRAAVLDCVAALEARDFNFFARCLNEYSRLLRREGLEAQRTTEDLESLRSLPGVLGAKGAGALQSDAIVVCVSEPETRSDAVIALAERRGLRLVARGLGQEKGIS